MKIPIIVIAVALLSIAAGFYINHRMNITAFNQKLSEAIKTDQEAIGNVLFLAKSDLTPYGKATRCMRYITENTKLSRELQNARQDTKSDLRNTLVEFLSMEGELAGYVEEMNIKKQKMDFVIYSIEGKGSEYFFSHLNEVESKDIYYLNVLAHEGAEVTYKFKDKYEEVLNKEHNLEKVSEKEGITFNTIIDKNKESNMTMANEYGFFFSEVARVLSRN